MLHQPLLSRHQAHGDLTDRNGRGEGGVEAFGSRVVEFEGLAL